MDVRRPKLIGENKYRDRAYGYPTSTGIRYEYRCPYCGHVNVRYEPCARIVCDRCGASFSPCSSRW